MRPQYLLAALTLLAVAVPHVIAAQESAGGLVPTATISAGEPERTLRAFFEGSYDVVQESWGYPSSEASTVQCSSDHTMQVDGFVLVVDVACEDGTEFMGLHSYDRGRGMYFNPGFSNGAGYVGGVFAEFSADGLSYVSRGPTPHPVTGETIEMRYAATRSPDGYLFEVFLIFEDGSEFRTLRHSYSRTGG